MLVGARVGASKRCFEGLAIGTTPGCDKTWTGCNECSCKWWTNSCVSFFHMIYDLLRGLRHLPMCLIFQNHMMNVLCVINILLPARALFTLLQRTSPAPEHSIGRQRYINDRAFDTDPNFRDINLS